MHVVCVECHIWLCCFAMKTSSVDPADCTCTRGRNVVLPNTIIVYSPCSLGLTPGHCTWYTSTCTVDFWPCQSSQLDHPQQMWQAWSSHSSLRERVHVVTTGPCSLRDACTFAGGSHRWAASCSYRTTESRPSYAHLRFSCEVVGEARSELTHLSCLSAY